MGRVPPNDVTGPPVMAEGSPPREPASAERSESSPSKRRGLPPWALSCLIHVGLLIALGLLMRPVVRGVEGDEPSRAGGLVLVSNNRSQTEYLDQSEFQEQRSQSDTRQLQPTDAVFPDETESPLDASGIFPTTDGLIGPSGGQSSLVPDAGELLKGLGGSGEFGQQTTTEIFGAQGTGSKFVFVFDRSSSMEGFGGRPLDAAQAELAGGLDALGETHQFQIIFYNESPSVFNPHPNRPPTLMFGTEDNREQAKRFIQSIQGAGGTEHLQALTMALNMAPDVIFFLTDAREPRLNESELQRIRRRNRSGASINTIEFGAGSERSGDNFLRTLARQNQGQYVYVDVTRLPNSRP